MCKAYSITIILYYESIIVWKNIDLELSVLSDQIVLLVVAVIFLNFHT